jgi:polysaccharide pyruvyl transferase WcaK-like protein
MQGRLMDGVTDERAVMAGAAEGAVAVLGHYGQLNLGDESLTAAVITGVRSLRPNARLIGISLNPVDTRARHGLESFSLRGYVAHTPVKPPPPAARSNEATRDGWLRRTLRRLPGLWPLLRKLAAVPQAIKEVGAEMRACRDAWRALTGVDLVIVAGSNQLLDQMGGAFGFPYTLLKWAVLARLRGARVVLISVGAGPLEGSLARRFCLWTLKLADYVSVRDAGSARLVREIGWRGEAPVLPDLAFGLDVGPMRERRDTSSGGLTIAVNLMPVHDARYWPEAKTDIGSRYVATMAAFVDRLLELGHRVELFGTQPADEWVAEDLVALLAPASRTKAVSIAQVRSLDDLGQIYRRADVVVATRFHGILLALRYARPVLGVCYYRKSRELMQEFGLERYAFDLATVSLEQLDRAFAELCGERAALERSIGGALPARADALARQYRRVLAFAASEAVPA